MTTQLLSGGGELWYQKMKKQRAVKSGMPPRPRGVTIEEDNNYFLYFSF